MLLQYISSFSQDVHLFFIKFPYVSFQLLYHNMKFNKYYKIPFDK